MIRTQTLSPGMIIPLTTDYVFTNFFNDENNLDILENFLSCYLKIPLEKLKGNIKLQNRKPPIHHKHNRNIEVDLLIIDRQNKMM